MKANELRIDNWVISKDGRHIQMNRIMLGVVPLLSPIPLTPEVLEKCGAVSNAYQDRYEFDEIDNLHFEYCGIRNIIWSEKYPHIQHLHQLQNLYFALTGEELIYKP